MNNKILRMLGAVLAPRLIAVVLLACALPAAAANGTLVFTSDGGAAWSGGIATDGQGGSTDLAGIAIQVLDISDTSGTNLGVPIEWHNDVDLATSTGFTGLTTFDPSFNAAGWKGMEIKSSDGSEFKITQFRWYDWSWAGGAVNVVGYRNLVQVASTSFTANSSDLVSTVNLDSSFQDVDEVRITYATSGWPSINDIAIADAVAPPGAPTGAGATAGDAQATVTFTAPASDGGSAITAYTATSSPGGQTGSCAGPAACAITVTGLTNGTAYTFTVTATNANGTGPASTPSNSVTPKGAQTITFNNPGAQNFGTSPTLAATATSGLTVSFSSSTTGVCTITGGGTLTFVSVGTCTINADQAGNGSYQAASTVTQSFSVLAVVPGAPTIGTATAGDTQATVAFTPPAFTGGATITGYTATASPGGATASGAASPITVTGLANGTAYTFTVTATNAVGTGPASTASNSVTPQAAQTITFNNPGAQNFGTTPTLTATASSGLTVTFTSSTTGVCTITTGGALAFVTAGTCTINADQAGNASFLAAPQVSRSFTVNAVVPGAPTIGTATAGDTQATVAFTPPAFTGGAPITGYTATANPGGATGSGAASPITVTGLTDGTAYTFTVTATNAAGTGPASAASNSVTPKAAQTITFNNPGAQNFGTTPTLTATSTSALAVTFTSSTTGVCTITSGGALTFVATGTCTINADQAGDGAFLAAPQVSRSFAVNAVVPGAPTIGTATAGDAQATVAFTPPAFIGGATITGYTATANPGGATGSGAASPITVTGLTNGTAYTFTVTATNSAGTGSASAASNSVTPKGAQTITFNNPGAQSFGTTPTLTATSTSALTVTFSSSTTAVCTITSGGVLAFVTTGTCTINADQAGNGSFLAAPQVSQSFAVNAVVPGAPTIGTATPGSQQATIAFTAPASTGGAAITSYAVTCNPGGITATGASSPITVTGLTNGTAYTCSVTATNSAGTGAASGTAPVTPVAANSYTAPSATGTGMVTASFTGGGPGCTFTTSQFIRVTGDASSPPAGTAPGSIVFLHGLFDFTTGGCNAGGTITMTIAWPGVLPPGTQYYKYGPTPGDATPHWYVLPATISGNVTTFTITDGGLGDDDLAANGVIVDQGGPGTPGSATAVPTLGLPALASLALLLGWFGMRRRTRR